MRFPKRFCKGVFENEIYLAKTCQIPLELYDSSHPCAANSWKKSER